MGKLTIGYSVVEEDDMKLIIIHGPPAAGKLTTANEIAAATGFKVFHNHLSIAAFGRFSTSARCPSPVG